MGSFSLVHWMILAAIVYLIYRVLTNGSAKGAAMYCSTCGSEGPTQTSTKGSIWLEIVLWLCFIVPGVIYSVWRLTTRHKVCASCGATTLMPPNSPKAMAEKSSTRN